jgi:NAD(P)-dependent dehydrogenase (short-subunit alcohol dehydrogenase family)
MRDYFGYEEKVCVITGAASGIGKAATEMLVDLGAKVYALDRTEVTTPGIAGFVEVDLGTNALSTQHSGISPTASINSSGSPDCQV